MRYGENVDEVNARGSWTCPHCRDPTLCNCSQHRTRLGWGPTGTLYRRAIAEGCPFPPFPTTPDPWVHAPFPSPWSRVSLQLHEVQVRIPHSGINWISPPPSGKHKGKMRLSAPRPLWSLGNSQWMPYYCIEMETHTGRACKIHQPNRKLARWMEDHAGKCQSVVLLCSEPTCPVPLPCVQPHCVCRAPVGFKSVAHYLVLNHLEGSPSSDISSDTAVELDAAQFGAAESEATRASPPGEETITTCTQCLQATKGCPK